MASSAVSSPPAQTSRALQLAARFYPILLFVMALIPRLAAVGRYITPDELIWVYRSIVFREALLSDRWLDTIVAGHPGVTTTWLGALTTSLQLAFSPASREPYQWLARMAYLTPDNTAAFQRLSAFLNPDRVSVAFVASLGVVAVFYLARRLWGMSAAVVASFLLAFDPFLAGLSGLFHVDALSATFGVLSLLALLLALRRGASQPSDRSRLAWLAFSGALAGFGVLSKSPLLVLGPLFGLALVVDLFRAQDLGWPARLWRFVLGGAAWGVALLAVIFVFYPAMWVDPLTVARSLTSNANRHIDEALRPTFFLGRVTFNHGPLFYPVVLLWRLSPVVVAGLVLLPFVWWKSSRDPAADREWLWQVGLLLAWAALFLAAVTPAAKKFDRYALPAIPALILVAGVTLAIWTGGQQGRRWLMPAIIGLEALYLLAFIAYPLSAYNPLVGGPWTAQRVLPIGWGEGISAGGRWLAANEAGAEGEAAVAGIAPSLARFFPGRTLVDGIDDPAAATYVIQTLSGRQTRPPGAEAVTDGLELLRTVRYGGLEQAWVYRQTAQPQPGPEALLSPVAFGDAVRLVAATPRDAGDGMVQLAAEWQRQRPLAAGERFMIELALRDADGNEWATVATDLLDANAFYPSDWESDASGTVHYLMETPPGIPPGEYTVGLSVVDARSGEALPVRSEDAAFLGVDYRAGILQVPPSSTPNVVTRMQIPVVNDTSLLDGALRLLGYSELAPEALAGSDLPVALFWHAPGQVPAGLQVAWELTAVGGAAQTLATEPLSRYDTGEWREAETIHEKYRVPLPPPLEPGEYDLSARLLDESGNPVAAPVLIGRLKVNNIDRLYDLPAGIPIPLDDGFGEGIHLRGLGLEPASAAAGTAPELTLIWQTDGELDSVYTAFVHLLNANDKIVAQFDHWPGGLPSDIWDAGQVIVDRLPIALPADLSPGEYRFAIGLYTAEDGHRLPAGGPDAAGADRLVLPVTLTVTAP